MGNQNTAVPITANPCLDFIAQSTSAINLPAKQYAEMGWQRETKSAILGNHSMENQRAAFSTVQFKWDIPAVRIRRISHLFAVLSAEIDSPWATKPAISENKTIQTRIMAAYPTAQPCPDSTAQ